MFIGSSEMVVLAVLTMGVIFVLMRLDRYLSQRRSELVNARFLADMDANRYASHLHWSGVHRGTKKASMPGLIVGPEEFVRVPGLFSRRRVITDLLGRTVATHYEELRFSERSPMSLSL